ncbi:MAG: hypothetical protein LBG23_04705 [Endomicrobium sp.]|jgi:hypothetical protein|nr:hypothetical protein [Endomicrobium sp.]
MKRLKVIKFIILLFCTFSYCYADVNFITQSDVSDNSKWNQITNSNPGVFFGNFDISSVQSLNDNATICSDQSIKRTLNASNNNLMMAKAM